MANYQYQCSSCSQTQWVQHRMGEQPALSCRYCGGMLNQRVYHGFAIQSASKNRQEARVPIPSVSASTPHQCHAGCAWHTSLEQWLKP
jgi:putative FmdB family regulatory protein